ncbi:flagellar hook-length control protein FliK [Shouchella hunanensis]|uniref:Flagellar hook-length control protein FliK n=1 Tax=Shouchella hunanensis TaxID=766894 RepID=A0ABY7W482_9BACI|nr:flagellar hook-length control protein FliK [Shouchella hunanensis]WDF03767.1 flagellar hook-length control protein FliK [Shouchella hunanensis]
MTHQANTVMEGRSTIVGSTLTKRGSPKSMETTLFSTTMDLFKEQVSWQMERNHKEEQLDGELIVAHDNQSQTPLQGNHEVASMLYLTELMPHLEQDVPIKEDKLVDESHIVNKQTFYSAEVSETSNQIGETKQVKASDLSEIPMPQSTQKLHTSLRIDDGQYKDTETRPVMIQSVEGTRTSYDGQRSESVLLNKADASMPFIESEATPFDGAVPRLNGRVVNEERPQVSADMIVQEEELPLKQENIKQQEIEPQDIEQASLKKGTTDVVKMRTLDEKLLHSNDGQVEEASADDLDLLNMEKHGLTEEHAQKELSQSGTTRQQHTHTVTISSEPTKQDDRMHAGERYVVDKQPVGKVVAEPVKPQESNDSLLTRQLLRIIRAAKTTYTAERHQQVLVKLHPESLGRVTIQFMQQGQGFVVKIIAERQTAKEALDRSLNQLRQLSSLQDTKVEVVKMEDDWSEQEKQQGRQEENDQMRKQRLLEAAQKKKTTDFQDWMSTILSRGVNEYDAN